MSKKLTNNVNLDYMFNEEQFNEQTSVDIEKFDPKKPEVKITKVGSPSTVRSGDTITYNVTINIADGDDVFGSALFVDTIDSETTFIVGSLRVNGVIAPTQDITALSVELKPNTVIQIEYKCLVK